MFGHLHPIMFFDTLMNSVSDWVCDHAISLFTVWNRRQDRVLTRLLHCPFLSVYQGGTPAVHFDGLADFPPNCLRWECHFFFSSPLSISPKGADFDIVLHWPFHFPAEYKKNLELNILNIVISFSHFQFMSLAYAYSSNDFTTSRTNFRYLQTWGLGYMVVKNNAFTYPFAIALKPSVVKVILLVEFACPSN